VWQRSVTSRILGNDVHVGKLPVTGRNRQPFPGEHEATIDAHVWDQAQASRTGQTQERVPL